MLMGQGRRRPACDTTNLMPGRATLATKGLVMFHPTKAVIFLVAVPVFAFAFSLVTWVLSRFFDSFSIEGRGGIFRFYGQFLIIAALYVAVVLLGVPLWIGFVIMFLGYRFIFGAGWLQAVVIGFLGGTLGMLLFPIALKFLEQEKLVG
jgi:hypothetical protein